MDLANNKTDDDEFFEVVHIVADRQKRYRVQNYRQRNNCLEFFSGEEFLVRYRFPKDCVQQLVQFVSPEISSITN